MPESGKTQECPSCAMDVDYKAETCPICGYEFPRQKKSTIVAVWLFIFLLLAWAIF